MILVITSIILLILLIVNLDCIKFTEATVNTSTTATSLSTASIVGNPTQAKTPLSPNSIFGLSTKPPPTQLAANSTSDQNNEAGPSQNTTTTASNSIENNNDLNTVSLAKIKNSDSNVAGGGDIELANITTTTPDSSAISTTNNINSITNDSLGSQQTNMSSNSNELEQPQAKPCPMPTPDRNQLSAAANETSKYFDIDYAATTFQSSMADKNAISLHHYLNGFKELMKFFHSLGTIFLFVTSDLENKIGLLEGYRNNEKGGCNPAYLTIQSVIEYETKENLLRDSKRQSGARTILRLHRALEFLSSLMLNLSKLDDAAETAPAAREAYSNTLANHHPWTIRTIASFAMRTLPHKKTLVESVLGKEHAGNETVVNKQMLLLANVTENLFNVVDKFYEEHDIKDLP